MQFHFEDDELFNAGSGLKYKLTENQDECCNYGWGNAKLAVSSILKQYKTQF
jgi:hypothetical protein